MLYTRQDWLLEGRKMLNNKSHVWRDGQKVNTTVLDAYGHNVEKIWKVDTNSREDFTEICQKLANQEIVIVPNVTLRDLINFSLATNREVAVFYDKLEPSKEKNIVVFAAKRTLKQVGGAANIGASVNYPPDGKKRYQFIAHVHPTNSEDKRQIVRDISSSEKQVEMVVTTEGLIVYYNNEYGILNKTAEVSSGVIVKPQLRNSFRDSGIDLNTPIIEKTLICLNDMVEEKQYSVSMDGDESEQFSLFSDTLSTHSDFSDIDFNSDESDEEDPVKKKPFKTSRL